MADGAMGIDLQEKMARLSRAEVRGIKDEQSLVTATGAMPPAWTIKVVSLDSYNVYNVQLVNITGAGVSPAPVTGDIQAYNIAESFTERQVAMMLAKLARANGGKYVYISAGRAFSLGADGRHYWFWSREALLGDTPNTLWTGTVAHIERASARGLILRPDIVADALGVGALRTTQPNVAVVSERYKREFILDYVRLADGRLRLLKKVRLDRMTGGMTRIDYFAPNGTQVLFATFDGERTTDDVRLTRRVTLEMPLSDSAVRFDLRTLRLNRRLGPDAFTQPDFDGANHIDLDREP